MTNVDPALVSHASPALSLRGLCRKGSGLQSLVGSSCGRFMWEVLVVGSSCGGTHRGVKALANQRLFSQKKIDVDSLKSGAIPSPSAIPPPQAIVPQKSNRS